MLLCRKLINTFWPTRIKNAVVWSSVLSRWTDLGLVDGKFQERKVESLYYIYKIIHQEVIHGFFFTPTAAWWWYLYLVKIFHTTRISGLIGSKKKNEKRTPPPPPNKLGVYICLALIYCPCSWQNSQLNPRAPSAPLRRALWHNLLFAKLFFSCSLADNPV